MTKSIILEIREDPQYQVFTKVFMTTKKAVDVESLSNEILGLHAGRTSRALYGERKFSPKALLEADSIDLSARSRLVEIRVKADLKFGSLREAIAAMRKYILTTYADDLKEFAGVNAKKAVADRVMKSAMKYMSEGDTLIKSIDHLVKDLDAAGHSLHRQGVLVSLLSNVKGRVL